MDKFAFPGDLVARSAPGRLPAQSQVRPGEGRAGREGLLQGRRAQVPRQGQLQGKVPTRLQGRYNFLILTLHGLQFQVKGLDENRVKHLVGESSSEQLGTVHLPNFVALQI